VPEDVYTHGHHESVLRSHGWRTAENSAAHLLPELRPGMSVLDVGCGLGTITVGLARRVAPGPVLGIDRSAEVIGRAAASSDLPANVAFATGDVYRLDAGDASVDIVHAHQVLHHLSDPVRALREMRRVCRPGGVVAVRDADYGAFTWAPEDDRLAAWLDTFLAVARSNGAEPCAGRHLKRWVREAGFPESVSTASVWCFSEPGDRTWWAGSWAERVVSSDFATQAVDRGHATREDLDGMADAFRSWAAHPDGWFAVLHGEVLARP
jgi:ubiquinone/menaquinone biosynthesis C-methylase UbiE